MTTDNEKKFDLNIFSEFEIPTEPEWREAVEKSLKGGSFEKLLSKTYEGIQLKPIYTKEDTKNLKHVNELPGEGSYVRGTKHLGNVSSPWKISQEITGRSPKAFNEALKNDLSRGQTSINLVMDEATVLGLDSDEAQGELIGLNGVPVSSVEDIAAIFKDLSLEENSTFIQAENSALSIFSFLVSYAKNENIDLNKVEAFLGADPLGSLAKRGKSTQSVTKQYDGLTQAIKWANEHAPKVRMIHVQGTPYNNAGSSATQELGYALATAVDYLKEMIDRGVKIDEAAKHIYFSFAVGANFFMEVAKIRAARLLWAKIVSAFNGNEQSQKMYIHARTSSYTKSVYDPYVNMLRTTTEAFAGAVGGADSMHVSPFDEAIRPADQFSRRIARNTQIILQEESHLDKIVDPAGGSWYVESLTDQVAENAWTIFQGVEKNGGMLQALQSGVIQDTIKETADQKRKNINNRKERLVGTNMYPNLEEKPLGVREEFENLSEIRKETLKGYKSGNRSEVTVNGGSILTDLFKAVEQGATIGELSKALADGGTEVTALPKLRAGETFEELRRNAESYKAANGEFPKVFVANLGEIPKHKARSDFAFGFFAAGGFESVKNDGYHTIEEAVQAFLASNITTVVICGSDEQYEEIAPSLAKEIKNKNPHATIMLAGKPSSPELESSYKEAGVDEFIHVRSNCYEVLARLQQQKGVK